MGLECGVNSQGLLLGQVMCSSEPSNLLGPNRGVTTDVPYSMVVTDSMVLGNALSNSGCLPYCSHHATL